MLFCASLYSVIIVAKQENMSKTTRNTAFKTKVDNCTAEQLADKEPEEGSMVNVEGVLKMGNGSAFVDVGSGGDSVQKNGFIDYNNSGGIIPLTANTWTDVPNDGAGAFTNKSYKPDGITELMDNSNGYLDFSELSLGSELLIRNDFTVNPNTNNSLLEVRYILGQGAGEYALKFWSERLDSGSGIDYQRVVSFPIYMGDSNTQGGVGKLQLKLSTNGMLKNAGSYVSVSLR